MPFAEFMHENSTSSQFQHPLRDRANLLSCVRLLDVSKFWQLASPLPRSQDLPAEYFGEPSSSGDQVVSVSHAWRNQAHPDPTCHKMRLLGQLLPQITGFTAGTSDADPDQNHSVFLFLDFVSIPQRPFRPGQPERTAEEVAIFKEALHCMHEMYFYSDRIIHLPWEDVDVPGEGVEDTLPARVLLGTEFAEFGARVQVASQSREGIAQEGRYEATAKLFDQVLSVDGQMVSSSTQLASLLGSKPQLTRVRHYPFGNYSMIPADARGWVFLERFITMVKCAMMDEDTAKHVVVTPSDAIFQQIMRGAHTLREASLQEKVHNKHGELKRALESFTAELGSKQFSPASTDKREMNSATAKIDEDRAVVSRIMQEFVEHLSAHWETEAARQRRLGSRLKAVVTVAETYLVEWECFSEEYAAALSAASATKPWHVPLVIFIPPPVAVAHLLWPYSSPDAAWASQGEFWGLSASLACFWISFSLAVGVAKGTNLPYSRWSVPPKQRASRQFRARLATSLLAIVVIQVLYGVVIPLLNGAIPLVSKGWQPLLVSCYLVLKLAFEFLGLRLSKVLGADTMTYFIFIAAFLYQVTAWFLVVAQICFDVLENSYHLYSLFHQDHSRMGGARREQYIVASLAIREFVEVVVPGVFLAVHELLRALRPESFALFCDRSEQEVQRTVHFLLVALAVELVGSAATYGLLRSRGHEPLVLLRGVIATRLDAFALIACGALTYYFSMQHSHFGMDLSFQFLWVAKPDTAIWQCGLTWAVPSADAAT